MLAQPAHFQSHRRRAQRLLSPHASVSCLQLIEVQDTLRHPANPPHGGPDADVVAQARGPIRKMRKVGGGF